MKLLLVSCNTEVPKQQSYFRRCLGDTGDNTEVKSFRPAQYIVHLSLGCWAGLWLSGCRCVFLLPLHAQERRQGKLQLNKSIVNKFGNSLVPKDPRCCFCQWQYVTAFLTAFYFTLAFLLWFSTCLINSKLDINVCTTTGWDDKIGVVLCCSSSLSHTLFLHPYSAVLCFAFRMFCTAPGGLGLLLIGVSKLSLVKWSEQARSLFTSLFSAALFQQISLYQPGFYYHFKEIPVLYSWMDRS